MVFGTFELHFSQYYWCVLKMCIIVAHVVSTIVFKYCNFVLLVNRVIMLDVFQEKTAGKFNICIYLSLSIKVVIKV